MPMRKKHHKGRKTNVLGPLTSPSIRHLANQLLAPDRRMLRSQSQAMGEMGKLVADKYGEVAPAIEQAYGNAAQTTLNAGQGFSADMRAALSGQNADTQAYLDKVTRGTGANPVNADAAGDALYGTGAYIPGTALTREGAAATGAASQLGATALANAALQRQAFVRQGMLDLAGKRSEMIPQLMQLAISQQAQNLYGRQFQEEKRQNKRNFKLQVAGLQLQQQREARYLQQMVQDGLQIDASASRVLGYVVDKNGNPVIRNGHKIKVADTSSAGDRKKAYQDAVQKASDILPQPVQATSPLAQGKYQAKPGAKGVFADGTTNDPTKAKTSGDYNWAEALKFLQNRYGISRKRARAALIASGWKPWGHVGSTPLPH